jgi:2-C-methyl-D-erythritol 4-phosphate cytidylyltransferase
LSWSLEALAEFGCDPIVVVVPPEHVDRAAQLASASGPVQVVEGGPSRQVSVARGLDAVARETVVVHDAARPFLAIDLLKRVVDALAGFDGAIAALPVDETLKSVERERVVDTIDRSSTWRAQTPQVFHTEMLRAAHERARADGFVATDDAQLIERAGGSIGVVDGDRRNIKLTYEADFLLAEAIARSWP